MAEKRMRQAAIEQFSKAVTLYQEGHNKEAERAFEKTVNDYPGEIDVVHRARQYMSWFTSQPPVPEEASEPAEIHLQGERTLTCPVCASELTIGDGVLRVWCEQCEDYINVDPDYGPVAPMETLYEYRHGGREGGNE